MIFRLAVIIINYRTPNFIRNCLESLNSQLDPQRDIVVIVDNASNDGSDFIIEQFIKERSWTQWVRLLRSPKNGGFSAGNNYGIRRTNSKFYLLLNSDTLVRPDAIKQLLYASERYKEIFLFSPRLEWPDRKPQKSCFRFWRPSHEFFAAARTGMVEKLFAYQGITYSDPHQPMTPDWISFACVLIRKEALDRIGLLDEGYFMYFDDMDFCRRAREEGLDILHWPAARVVHLRGGSGPVKQLAAARKRPPKYWYSSRNRYYAKFYGRLGLWQANLFWYAGRILSLAREMTRLKQPHTCERQWLDIWTNALKPLEKQSIFFTSEKCNEKDV